MFLLSAFWGVTFPAWVMLTVFTGVDLGWRLDFARLARQPLHPMRLFLVRAGAGLLGVWLLFLLPLGAAIAGEIYGWRSVAALPGVALLVLAANSAGSITAHYVGGLISRVAGTLLAIAGFLFYSVIALGTARALGNHDTGMLTRIGQWASRLRGFNASQIPPAYLLSRYVDGAATGDWIPAIRAGMPLLALTAMLFAWEFTLLNRVCVVGPAGIDALPLRLPRWGFAGDRGLTAALLLACHLLTATQLWSMTGRYCSVTAPRAVSLPGSKDPKVGETLQAAGAMATAMFAPPVVLALFALLDVIAARLGSSLLLPSVGVLVTLLVSAANLFWFRSWLAETLTEHHEDLFLALQSQRTL